MARPALPRLSGGNGVVNRYHAAMRRLIVLSTAAIILGGVIKTLSKEVFKKLEKEIEQNKS